MKKIFSVLFLIILILLGFYAYTQSGEILNESLPDENLLMQEENLETPLGPNTTEEIMALIQEAETKKMSPEEKKMMEKKIVAMMNPEEKKAIEPQQAIEEKMPKATRQGKFIEIDLIHKGSGKALIYSDTANGPLLRLQNFKVTRGPDLYVYLSKNKNISSADQLGEFVNLGVLKSSKGNQNYALPLDHADYNSVVIWCKAFSVLFSSATLE